MKSFGKKIRKLRESRGLTTRMLAEQIGLSCGQISKYENGIHEPTLSVLNKYKKFFGVTLDYLCDEDDEEEKKEE